MITPLEDSTVHRPPRLHAVTVAKYITPGSNTPLQVKSTRIDNTGQIQSVHSKLRKGRYEVVQYEMYHGLKIYELKRLIFSLHMYFVKMKEKL